MGADVIVIGTGPAGLQTARRLQRAGHAVAMLEAADAVGGRVRTSCRRRRCSASPGRASEPEVRRDPARLYGTSTRRWEVLAHHVVQHALPAQRPGPIRRGPIWTGERVLVTGDHAGSAVAARLGT